MRRALFLAACVVTFGLAWFFRCRHGNAVRHPMGWFTCPDCGYSSADLPTLEQPYMQPTRRTYDRLHGEITHSDWSVN